MSNDLKSFMSHMGTGPKSSDDLDYDGARTVMGHLLQQRFHPVTFGGFMVAQRWKSEAVPELAGFLDELRDTDVQYLEPEREFFLDVAGRFDGKQKAPNTDFPGSLLAAAAGVPIFTHSGREIPTKPTGSTFLDLVEELGWDPDPDPSTSETALDDIGFSYAGVSRYSPGLEALKSYRQEMGVRTFLNTLESMLNPANAPVHLGSFYHLAFASRVCDVFEAAETLDLDRVLMVQGMEGQPEFRPGSSLLAEWEGGELDDRTVRSEQLNMAFNRDQLEELGADPPVGADLLVDLLEGRDSPPAYRRSVLLNAAVRLYAGRAVEDLEEGVEQARATLENGDAGRLLEQVEEVFERG